MQKSKQANDWRIEMIIDQGLNFQPINAENKGEGIFYLTQQGINDSDDLVIVTPDHHYH